MVKFEAFEITVWDPVRKVHYPEVRHNGKNYVVARPGSTFEVAVKRGMDYHGLVNVALKVDGACPGYTFTLRTVGQGTTFNGFLKQHGGSESKYAAFQFSEMAQATAGCAAVSVDNLDQIKQGKLSLTFSDCIDSAEPAGHVRGVSMTHASKPKLEEGKKFFMAPSLAASEGKIEQRAVTFTKTKMTHLGEIGRLTIHYETADTLVLRKVLDPLRPDHAQIIKEYRPAPTSEGASPVRRERTWHPKAAGAGRWRTTGSGPADGAGTSAAAGARVKDEPGTSARPRTADAGPTAVVDLTGDMPPVRINGKRVARDEVAVCDLTGAGPSATTDQQWRVIKKERISL